MERTWRHKLKGNRIEIVIELFDKFPKWARRGAELEAERLAAFQVAKDRSSRIDSDQESDLTTSGCSDPATNPSI